MKASLLSERFSSLPRSTVVVLLVLGLGPLLGWALANEAWLIVIALGGVIVAPALLRWPVVLTVGLYGFLIPFDSVAAVAGGATLTRLLGVAAGGTLLVVGLMEGRLARAPAAAMWWALFLLWGAMTAMWAIDTDPVFSRLRTALSLFVLYAVCVSFRVTRKELTWVCVLTIAGGAAAAITAYVVGLDSPDTQTRATVVVADRAANANAFGGSLLMPMALAVGMFLSAQRLAIKIVAIGAIAMIAGGIGLSISRGAILAACLLLLVLVYRTGVQVRVALVGVALVGLVALMPEAFFTRIAAPFTGEDATGAGRTEIWRVGIAALGEFWLWGSGLQNFPLAYARHTILGPLDLARAPHSIYLGVWVELGIVGLVLMLAAIWSHLADAWRVRRGVIRNWSMYAAEAGCVAMLAHSVFSDRLWLKTFWMGWILLGWAVRLAREEETLASSPESAAEGTGPGSSLSGAQVWSPHPR